MFWTPEEKEFMFNVKGFNRLFESILDESDINTKFSINAMVENDEVRYEVNLAGFTKDEIKVKYNSRNVILEVDGERGKFTKVFVTPTEYDAKPSVKFENGLLKISLFKKEEEKEIEVDF